jgi:hypothetical protein
VSSKFLQKSIEALNVSCEECFMNEILWKSFVGKFQGMDFCRGFAAKTECETSLVAAYTTKAKIQGLAFRRVVKLLRLFTLGPVDNQLYLQKLFSFFFLFPSLHFPTLSLKHMNLSLLPNLALHSLLTIP